MIGKDNKVEIDMLIHSTWDQLQMAKDGMLDLKRELLQNYVYGVSNNRKFDELMFAYEQLCSAINHFSYGSDNVIKILDL